MWDGLKYPPRTSNLHAIFNGLCGGCQGGVWCGSRPSSWRLHPSNIKIDLGMRINGATKIAIILDLRGPIVLLVTPAAVELSIWIGLLGWGQPMAMRVWQWGIISPDVMKRAASSGLEAKVMTNLIIWTIDRMAPLNLGNGLFSER